MCLFHNKIWKTGLKSAIFYLMKGYRLRSITLILGDILFFYAGLALTILIRYGRNEFNKWWFLHFIPFSILFIIWVIIFMIAGLYDSLSFSGNRQIKDRIMRSMAAASLIGIIIFYIAPQFIITPKTTLIINLVIATSFIILWRKFYGVLLASLAKNKVIFFGLSAETEKLIELLNQTPHLGYEPTSIILPDNLPLNPSVSLPVFILNHNLPNLIHSQKTNLVVASMDIHNNAAFIKMLYEVLPLGVAYMNFPQFYERITGKIPISMISEIWFLENLAETEKTIFEIAKRAFDIIAGLFLGVFAVCLLPFIALAIKLESPGRIIFSQKRVGKNGKVFNLFKFRTMLENAEQGRAVWAKENDKRTTAVGLFLRKTRLDELPQIWNVLKGDMSLIGPRPERPEFMEELKEKIPHYLMRLLVRPGLSGWAQINFPYGASVQDALEKLQYDLYYIKNRSLGLDLSIALKTLFTILSRSGR
jgi:exopolysaccharide biosynthesis polyprenyl glycosylphosphotransferase